MQYIFSTTALKDAIQLLEVGQAVKGQLLKKQFHLTNESLKPVNLLKSTLKEATSSPYLMNNILITVIGLATGYFSKRVIVGVSVNRLRKLTGSVLQFGLTNLLTKHPDAIRSFSQYVFQRIFRKKEKTASLAD